MTGDKPQITMHALDLDHLRGECRLCGREPEHPCHGSPTEETKDTHPVTKCGDLSPDDAKVARRKVWVAIEEMRDSLRDWRGRPKEPDLADLHELVYQAREVYDLYEELEADHE